MDRRGWEDRILTAISGWKNTGVKKMFGGVCHLINGNMFCGVYRDYLILRLGEAAAAEALKSTGRPMKGWVMMASSEFRTEAALHAWLGRARNFAAALPPK
jgi:TfoX/Sxy family transcriptional regulator of competence genes